MKVSVCITAYNHEKYIAQALDSVLMQQTDFDFEILVGEDQSSDSTRDIVVNYKSRHPEIRLFLHDYPADYIRVNGRKNFLHNLANANGKYIALLDGDDFWTDPQKLQKQVNFLDEHPEFSTVFHRVDRLEHGQIISGGSDPSGSIEIYTVDDLLERSNFIPTCSAVFRRAVIDELPDWISITPYGDLPLHVLNSFRGKIARLNESMATRRVHEAGLYTGKSRIYQVMHNLICFEIMSFHLNFYENRNYQAYVKLAKTELNELILDEKILAEAIDLVNGFAGKYGKYPSITVLQLEILMLGSTNNRFAKSERAFTKTISNYVEFEQLQRELSKQIDSVKTEITGTQKQIEREMFELSVQWYGWISHPIIAVFARLIGINKTPGHIFLTLEKLLSKPDGLFVCEAYQLLLCRQPDPDGMDFYLHQLKTGKRKIEILKQIIQSEEYRKIVLKKADISEFECENIQLLSPQNSGENILTSTITPKVIVGTGWWCTPDRSEWRIGDDFTRSIDFFRLWYRQVKQCLRPYRIHVTDSASPLLPDILGLSEIVWTTLDKNYGHANDIRVGNIKTKYCGFTRSVLLGACYALCCDADYYVYVEQDCLLRGDNILNDAFAGAASDILVGQPTVGGLGLYGGIAAPMLQQSLIVVARSGLERFIAGLMGGDKTDGEVSPEIKMETFLHPFGTLAIPYGRSRPIDFNLRSFYVQHLTLEELRAFLRTENLDEQDWLSTPNTLPAINKKIFFSCVVDTPPIFLYQAWNWAWSLIMYANVPPQHIFVHVISGINKRFVDKFADIGVQIIYINRFGDGKFCNKIMQLDTARLTEADVVYFMDVDMIVLQDIRNLASEQFISGKIVDYSNPQLSSLYEVFEKAGFHDCPPLVQVDLQPEQKTFSANFNGGLYIIPTKFIPDVSKTWKKWALWLLKNHGQFTDERVQAHVDQIAFCMSMHELKIPTNLLARTYNYPTHTVFNKTEYPCVLHYHRTLSVSGLLEVIEEAGVDFNQAIVKANDLISSKFDNDIFCQMFPES